MTGDNENAHSVLMISIKKSYLENIYPSTTVCLVYKLCVLSENKRTLWYPYKQCNIYFRNKKRSLCLSIRHSEMPGNMQTQCIILLIFLQEKAMSQHTQQAQAWQEQQHFFWQAVGRTGCKPLVLLTQSLCPRKGLRGTMKGFVKDSQLVLPSLEKFKTY